jgi:hypothetical protein
MRINAPACRIAGTRVDTRADAEELLDSEFVAVPDPAVWAVFCVDYITGQHRILLEVGVEYHTILYYLISKSD